MIKTVKLKNQKIKYDLRNSKRSRTIRLAIYNNGAMVVTKPYGLPNILATYFIRSNASKIIQRINALKKYYPKNNRHHYLQYKEKARKVIETKSAQISRQYGLTCNRIIIRNQQTRWGSCSVKRNLNFNYKIYFLPEILQEYVITHEICHLQEMNHSSRFWNLVENKIPNYKELRRELRQKRLINIG